MLRSVNIATQCFEHEWSISPLTGGLRRRRASAPSTFGLSAPEQVLEALKFCADPFKLEPCATSLASVSHTRTRHLGKAVDVASKIISTAKTISQQNFFSLRLYASYRRHIFGDSEEAFSYLNQHTDLEFDEHCLCRSFFVAKTAKTFAETGVLFVGAFLPTFQMHAWVIDGGKQPDPMDRDWINYTPLLAFYVSSKVNKK